MVVFMPRGWGEAISPRDGVSVSEEYSPEAVRCALESGERLFLIGDDAIGRSSGWLFASDHIALFGTGFLAGPNHDALGPRFPNLRGMYLVPSIPGRDVASGVVLRVPDISFTTDAELDCLRCEAAVSGGIDLAVTAAHGGGKVVFALSCTRPGEKMMNSFSFLNEVIQEIEGGEE